MSQTGFHSLRLRAISHGKNLSHFSKVIGADDIKIKEKVLRHASPSLVAVVGNRDAGKSEFVSGLVNIPVRQDMEGNTSESYRFTHHVDSPPYYDQPTEEAFHIPIESEYLKKHTFVEIRKEVGRNLLVKDPIISRAEGIIFLVDARDPWAGSVWRYFEQFSESHAGRIIFCVSHVGAIEKRDWPVLKKHLEEKVSQRALEKVELVRVDYTDMFTFHDIRAFLESYAVGKSKWVELRQLKSDFMMVFNGVDKVLSVQKSWLNEATDIANNLKHEFTDLKQRIRLELLLRIETMGASLRERADEILKEVRQRLTFSSYLRSLFGRETSLSSFQDGLEAILSEALYVEIGAHYHKTNQLVAEHANRFAKTYPSLAHYCPDLKGDGTELQAPFMLEKETVSKEILRVLRQLRLKPLFRRELEHIDEVTNLRLRLSMLLFAVGGFIGGFQHHLFAILFIVLGISVLIWAAVQRGKSLDSFVEFLNEWFLGVGMRMLEPIEYLSNNLVNHAMDTYGESFTPYLEVVKEQQEVIPKRLEAGMKLYEINRDLIKELTVSDV